jgi:ABC-type branched-subunit amino acid transport system ATPase component
VSTPDSERAQLRDRALADLGITRSEQPVGGLRAALREAGAPRRPLVVIGILGIADTFTGYAFQVQGPDIARTIGFGVGTLSLLVALKTVAIGIAPYPVAQLVGRHGRRALLCLITAVVWSVFGAFTALVTTVPALLVILAVDGLTTGSVAALHVPLLSDTYPARLRLRTISGYQAAVAAGTVLAPLLVALGAGPLDLTWRGVYLMLAALSIVAALCALLVRDVRPGEHDERRMQSAIREGLGGTASPERPARLSFGEAASALFAVPTFRRLLAAAAALGVVIIPFQTYLFFYLSDRWNMGAASRGLFFAGASALSAVALVVFGRRLEAAFARDPARALRTSGALLATGMIVGAGGALVPSLAGVVVMFSIAVALTTVSLPTVYATTVAVVPAALRPNATALLGIFTGAVGGIAGALLLGGLDRRYGLSAAIASLAVPGVLCGWLQARAGATAAEDIEAMVDRALTEASIQGRRAAGDAPKLIECAGLCVDYGTLRILFDVDFAVGPGEMVALLGTNGAGKTTLVRTLAGLTLPARGAVLLDGRDISYMGAHRRTGLGITLVSGGNAVFGGLTVEENLRMFAYRMSDRTEANAAVERSLVMFPDLRASLARPASTLSGGQRQMLGLSHALITRPKLLLIDELSLGLAPIVVGQLIEQVKAINRTGTAVVLIEQSANIALGVADHAYFMERGQIRFDGPSAELRERADLLRAVFLDGADALEAP